MITETELNEKSENKSIYFANQPSDIAANILLEKAGSFFNMLMNNAYLSKLERMWAMYHGADLDVNNLSSGHRITFGGEQGEIVSLKVNHFRNLAQHMLNMITSNRPIMQARAINTDYKSLAQTYLANSILDYYMREKHLEDALKKAVEMSIILGSGFVKLEWNATAGDAYDADPETGQIISEGELEFSNLSPFDVVFDGTKETFNHEWVLTRTRKNRFDLIAKYPEFKDKLLAQQPTNSLGHTKISFYTNDDTDDIYVYEFYHKRTEAVPEGRYMLFAANDVVLIDMKLPYRVMPIFRICPAEFIGTPYGYTPMFDIYPIQEAIDSIYSSVFTNQNAFLVQNVFVQEGSNLATYNLDGALNIIEGTIKPEPLNLTETPAEAFKFLDMLIQAAETISGINSVARGNPEASLKSGNALALVQSMALQFISGLQQNYVKMIEDVGTAVIQILKDYATTPKVIALVGKNNRPLLKEFTGENISSINRVVVDVGNPLARTTAGRVQMAEQMLQMNLIKTPEQYIQVINTGNIDVMFEGEMSELLLVKSENERLLQGEEVMATMLDQHKMHIQEHKSVLADPDLRRDKTLVDNTLNHIQQHINLLRTGDPDLLQLIGEQPLNPIHNANNPDLPPGPQQAEQQAGSAPAPQAQPSSFNQPPPQPGQPPESIQGPDGQTQNLPSLPQVPANLLTTPDLQQQSLGNVR